MTEEERLAEIVGDEDHGLSQFLLQFAEFALQLNAGDGSSAPKGSSMSSSGGSAASARATPTRCLCPPESSPGYR